jgi:hypothetical protein
MGWERIWRARVGPAIAEPMMAIVLGEDIAGRVNW